MGERRSDTRERIQSVALELFAEHGYEKTSLREIAERLNVTKAALYYHFKTKEDIIDSLFEAYHADVTEIMDWAETQPRTAETRREIVLRYSELVHGRAGALMRFVADNQGSVRDLKQGRLVRERFGRFARLMTEPGTPLSDQFRARLALFSVNASIFLMQDLEGTEEERHAAALEVALDLVSGHDRVPR